MSSFAPATGYRSDPKVRIGKRFDSWLLVATVILIIFGLVSLYSVGHKDNEGYFKKQLFYLALGVVPVGLFGFTKPRFWLRASNLLYAVNIISLLAIFKFGVTLNHSARWLKIGPVEFQPSEMAKLFTILTLASFYALRRDRIDKLSTFLLGLLHVGVPMLLILKQPHFGGALVIAVIWFSVSIAANVPFKFIGTTTALAALAVAVMFLFPSKFPQIIHGYHENRMDSFLAGGNSRVRSDQNYQTNQARIAFGVGGVVGAGLGKGAQGNMIPEQESDFIFTVPGEELGLIGCTLLLFSFGFLFYRIWLVMLHATDPFYQMIVTGILAVLAFHTFVNLFMVTQMLPVIGLWLPFMSYGGTAMWLCESCIALVLNVRGRERPVLF